MCRDGQETGNRAEQMFTQRAGIGTWLSYPGFEQAMIVVYVQGNIMAEGGGPMWESNVIRE